jgi:hypothetical protein
MVDKKRPGREFKILGWIAAGTVTFLFVALTYRESIKKHPAKPIQTPLVPAAASSTETVPQAAPAADSTP